MSLAAKIPSVIPTLPADPRETGSLAYPGACLAHAGDRRLETNHAPAFRTVIVPGWRNSGEGHWQTLWARRLPRAVRVQQADWESPDRALWVDSLTQTIQRQAGPVVAVAHSLGCIAAVHLPPAITRHVAAALLVAPANPQRVQALHGFGPVPRARLPYPSVVVASEDDPYCPLDLAGAYAGAWGSRLVQIGCAGHVNVASGHGEWPAGWALLQQLMAKVSLTGGVQAEAGRMRC